MAHTSMSIDNELRARMYDGVMMGVADGMAALVRSMEVRDTQLTLDDVAKLRDHAILLLSMIDKAFSDTSGGRLS